MAAASDSRKATVVSIRRLGVSGLVGRGARMLMRAVTGGGGVELLALAWALPSSLSRARHSAVSSGDADADADADGWRSAASRRAMVALISPSRRLSCAGS